MNDRNPNFSNYMLGNNKNKLSENQKKILITIGVLIAVIIIATIVIVCVKHFTNTPSKNENTKNPSVKVTSIADKDTIKDIHTEDPENIELSNENGAIVNSNNLPNKKGKANGIDVSRWQGKIDWSSVASSGIDYAMIRIGFRGENGIIYKDDYADYNIQEAVKNNILVGVYFFSTAKTKSEAIEEAEWTANSIATYPISYPVVYDCEGFNSKNSRMQKLDASERTNNALAFLNKIKSYGYDTAFYSSKSHLENNWETNRLEKKHKIWLAEYPASPYPTVKKPTYSGNVDMWQHTNRGKVSGISGNVDLEVSYFTKSLAKPKNTSSKQPDVSIPDSDAHLYKKVSEKVTAKEITNLRSAATTRSDIVGKLKNGEFIERIGIGSNGWSKLLYNGQTVYASNNLLTTDASFKPVTQGPEPTHEFNMTFKEVHEKVTAKSSTNLRSTPSSSESNNIVHLLSRGEVIERVGIGDRGWSKLIYNGQTVYAVTNLLTTDLTAPEQKEEPQSEGKKPSNDGFRNVNEIVTAKSETNLRSSPTSKEDNVVHKLTNGETVTRIGINDASGWSKLSYNGQTVYAVSSLLVAS